MRALKTSEYSSVGMKNAIIVQFPGSMAFQLEKSIKLYRMWLLNYTHFCYNVFWAIY